MHAYALAVNSRVHQDDLRWHRPPTEAMVDILRSKNRPTQASDGFDSPGTIILVVRSLRFHLQLIMRAPI